MYQTIEKKRKKLEAMRQKLISGQCNAVRELLPNHVIDQICEECHYFFRTRLLTPVVTIFHMIGAAIIREGSFQSSWHFSAQSGCSGSLAKARKRLPLEIWTKLHAWIVSQISTRHESQYLWQGHRVIGIDGTSVSMSDEPSLADHFGRSSSQHGSSRFPLAHVVFSFNLFSLICLNQEIDRYKVPERTLATRITSRLCPGDIIVEDRGFYGYQRFWDLAQQGIHFIHRTLPSFNFERVRVVKQLGSDDYLIDLPVRKEARHKNPNIPQFLRVRLMKIRAPIRGKVENFWIITSLLDVEKYSAHDIKSLYRRRWRIETLIEELKLWLGADILRSKTVQGILKEMQARVIAYNLTHWIILEAAKEHNKKPECLSASAALRLTAAYSLKMSTAPPWQLPYLYNELLDHVAHSIVPHRPNRYEPRLKKREDKIYSRLKIPRSEWRKLYAYVS